MNKNAYFAWFKVNKNVNLVVFNISKITSRCCGGSAPYTQELAIERIFVSPKERYLPRIDFNCRYKFLPFGQLCFYVGWLARVGCLESEGRRAVLYRVRRVVPRTGPVGSS